MLGTSARTLGAAAVLAIALGGAAAPIGIAAAQTAGKAATQSTGDQPRKKKGCSKYTPDSPEYKACMAQ
jgi:hypothetical protein